MTVIEISGTDNPDGLISLVQSLPSSFDEREEIRIQFPPEYLYSCVFPVIAAWAKRTPDGTRVTLDLARCQEAARRLVHNVGLTDIVENDVESPRSMSKGAANVPLQPIVVGRSTDEALDRVYRMVDDWAGPRDIQAFRTMLSELAENVLVHSEAASPGYVHARVHRASYGEKCEITFADTGIGILNSYLEGSNDQVKNRLSCGASAVQIAIDGLNSSKPHEISPGGRSYFGYGLYTVKRLIEMNRGRMTLISGDEYVTLDRNRRQVHRLAQPWHGTIVALIIDLNNPLPLDRVYAEEVDRLVPTATVKEKPQRTAAATESTVPVVAPRPQDNTKQLAVREIATQLLSRESGLALRAELATLLADGSMVEVLLDGVEDITPSVADECFAKLAVRLGDARFRARVQFRGGTPILHRLIEFVIQNRLRTLES